MIHKRALLLILSLLTLTVLSSTAQRSNASFPAVVDTHGATLDIVQASHTQPVIAIRFLGAICSHCMQQIVEINTLATKFKALNTRVIVFSEDPQAKCRETIAEYRLDTTLITLCTDSASVCSTALGTTISEPDGSITELHAFLLVDQGTVIFEKYTTTPMMALQAVVDLLATLPTRRLRTAP